ncbi:MAG TPA: hypothetical protein VEU51_04880 [Candidatus Acidoferrales bacterium]|nr:hypothetical protein [Candidatus Acidoferrales bacterium]
MRSSLRLILFGALGAMLLSLTLVAKSSSADMTEVDLNSEKVQVVHGTTSNSDTTTMTLDLTNNGDPSCDDGDDLIKGGLEEIALSNCSCEDFLCVTSGECMHFGFLQFYCALPFDDSIPNGGFVSHTIAGHQYGTFYSSTEMNFNGLTTLSAKATKLATPTNTCGRWTLNLTATKLNLSSITQSSPMHPIALFINDGDDSGPFCFDIKDAVVGPVIVH